MSARRVIFVNRVYWPAQAATAQLLTDLAEELAARGHEVHVIAAGTDSTPRHGVRIHRTGEGEQHGGLLSRAGNYLRFLRGARRVLTQFARRGDIVVLKTDPPLLGAFLTGPARRAGAHVVHWIQDIYPEIVSAHFGAALAVPLWPLRAWRDASWRHAAACVTLGTDMARTLARSFVPAQKITLIPNWAPRELHRLTPPDLVEARRQAWGLDDKFIVVYSGNLGRVHEFDAIVQAAAALREQTDIVFLFIGRGARFEEVRAQAAALGLASIRFLPPEPREHLPAALAAADVHLVTLKPSCAELVFPSKLAGVLAVGRPALFVGPPDGEIARLLAECQCGASVAPDEGAALAEILLTWRRDPARCVRLGRAARATYESRFRFQPAVERWESLLRSLHAPDA